MTAAGEAVYETWRAAVPEIVCNVPGGPWEELPEAVQAGFDAVADVRTAWRLLGETRADLAALTERAAEAGIISGEEAARYRLRARAET